jgi:AAA+ ATPase superfamily predicted ATPase
MVQNSFSNAAQGEKDPRLFFNREMEITALRTILNGPPRLTVMLGPPSTGKTRLINRVVSSLNVDGTPEFHAININLRGTALSSGKQFWEYVESTSRTASAADKAWTLFAESASKIKSLKISLTGLEVGLQESSIPNKYDLESFPKSVPIWKRGTDVPFVLVIDEANALKKLAENDYSVRRILELGRIFAKC